MPKSSFKVGDIVVLKSGGPEMTVEHVDDDSLRKSSVKCQWFAGKKLEEGWFPPDSLKTPDGANDGKK